MADKPTQVMPVDASIATGFAGSIFDAFYGDYQTKSARSWQERMWREQNQYNNPANQMQRLLDAGLNPDLIYSQLDSGSAAIPETTIPRSSFGATFNSAMSNSIQQGLMDSQIKLNEATAKKNEAEAQHSGRVTQELVDSWPYRLKQFGLQNGFTDAQIQQSIKLGAVYDEKCRLFSAQTENFNMSSRMLGQQYLTERNRTRYVGSLQKRTESEAAMMNARAARAREFVDAEINQMIQNAFRDSEQGKYMYRQTQLLIDTWDSLVSQEQNKVSLFQSQSNFYDSQARYAGELANFLPVQFVNQLALYEMITEKGSDGIIQYSNGFPVIKLSYAKTNRVFDLAGQSIDMLSDVAGAYSQIRFGMNIPHMFGSGYDKAKPTMIESTYDGFGKSKGFKVTEYGSPNSKYKLYPKHKPGQSSFHF